MNDSRMVLGIALTLALIACGKRYEPAGPETPDERIRSLKDLPGAVCDTQLMVKVVRADASSYCIDRFEASVAAGNLGLAHQGADNDTAVSTDGSTTAAAEVHLAVLPATRVSWYQAKAACANAGKRLCTRQEWELACRGPDQFIYPYGNTMNERACNGFYRYPAQTPDVTGSLASCGSAFGVYDMSGNVKEWVDEAVERVPATGIFNDRSIRGGSFQSNANGLACAGPEFHAPPGAQREDIGFRCCL